MAEKPSVPVSLSSAVPTSVDSFLDTGSNDNFTGKTSSNVIDLLDDIGIELEQDRNFQAGAAEKSTTGDGGKRPPPPPRPAIPPSKETKDLILSVTGAMEATSSDLLDRLQATRTPSPTPIRELHSPSPTPDMMQVIYVILILKHYYKLGLVFVKSPTGLSGIKPIISTTHRTVATQ